MGREKRKIMGIGETLLLAAGVAMDAAAVSMTNGMAYRDLKAGHYIAMPLLFGLFQGLMPLLGFLTGSMFADVFTRCSGFVIFAILGTIGGRMIYEGATRGDDAEGRQRPRLTVRLLLCQAAATSMDAFAVGVAFTAMRVSILPAVSTIAAVTALLVAAAVAVGHRAGDMLGAKAEIAGGAILFVIGLKSLL